MPNLINTIKDVVVMWSGSAQVANKPWYEHGISAINNHRAGYKNWSLVHKQPIYTRSVTLPKPPFNPLSLFQNNRLKLTLIPILHRPYIHDHNLNLMNI